MTARGTRRYLIGFTAIVVLLLGAWLVLLRDGTEAQSNDPNWTFNHGSIGNEDTQGLPYWIWRVLPNVFADLLPADQRGLSAVGVAWRSGAPLPVGFSQKTVGVISRVSTNCAFCHQGTYRLNKFDAEVIVSGGAGTRVDAMGYQRFLINVGKSDRFTPAVIMAAIKTRYDMPLWQRMLYRYILIPATRVQLQKQATAFSWANTRPDWGPGRVDMLNMAKLNNLGLHDDGTNGNADIMPLWGLNTTTATNQRRFALHWDGLSTDLHETVLTQAITSGMTYNKQPLVNGNLAKIRDFVSVGSPPPSPFSALLAPTDPYYVAPNKVARGAEIYATTCAACHDTAGARYRLPVSIAEVGTDRQRMESWSKAAMEEFADYEKGHNWDLEHFQKTNGYLATDLKGLWLRAPYLHNGSVPNLAALLAPPANRPAKFWRGSDLVDTKNGGFVSVEDGDPYRTMVPYDTTITGNSNSGHTWGTDLGPADKNALLAYLKTR